MTDKGRVNKIITEGVGEIEFYHPQSNSLPGELLRTIAATIEEMGYDDLVKVIVIKSSGDKTFCAGASFDELISLNDLEKGKYFFSGFASIINAIRKAPKFVIARVQGKAVGGGVGIACAADYTIATKSASVKLSELAVGIGPFVVGPAVERKIGKSAFTELSIDATNWRSSEWAVQKGLYSETHETIEQLDLAIHNLTTHLTTFSPEAMKMMKSVFWEGTENWDMLLSERAEMSGRLVLSEFTLNAINSFKTKK
jgi:methylglutaconyl-CoA hydratase